MDHATADMHQCLIAHHHLRGVEWVHGLLLFPFVLGKCSCDMQNFVFFV